MKKPLFITFEGIEGSGKTTQIKLLSRYLRSLGLKHVLTREPGGTELGDRLRKLILIPRFKSIEPFTELCIMLAARCDHVARVVRKNLRKGVMVICDRFTDATLAYQGGGRGLDLKLLKRLNDMATSGIRPDLTFLLDLPVEKGLKRSKKRLAAVRSGNRESRFENEKQRFHERVRAQYLRLLKADKRRIRLIDATKGIGQIAQNIRDMISNELDRNKGKRKG